jgi:hypothetical protein
MQEVISIFLYLLRLAFCPKIWSILGKVPWAVRRMIIVLLQDGILCRHLSGPLVLWCHSRISLLIFCLDDLSIGDGGVLKSPAITVLGPVILSPLVCS